MRWQTSNCSLVLIYLPRNDERLSWPGWLTYTGRFTHVSSHPSATGQEKFAGQRPVFYYCATQPTNGGCKTSVLHTHMDLWPHVFQVAGRERLYTFLCFRRLCTAKTYFFTATVLMSRDLDSSVGWIWVSPVRTCCSGGII